MMEKYSWYCSAASLAQESFTSLCRQAFIWRKISIVPGSMLSNLKKPKEIDVNPYIDFRSTAGCLSVVSAIAYAMSAFQW
jgi:hypothetical protein